MNERVEEAVYAAFVSQLIKPQPTAAEDVLHGPVGISKEAGELLDNVYRHWNYGRQVDRDNLVEELGDIRFYMRHLQNLFQITDQEILQYNVTKLSKRYPTGYSDAAALARADKQETDNAAG